MGWARSNNYSPQRARCIKGINSTSSFVGAMIIDPKQPRIVISWSTRYPRGVLFFILNEQLATHLLSFVYRLLLKCTTRRKLLRSMIVGLNACRLSQVLYIAWRCAETGKTLRFRASNWMHHHTVVLFIIEC